jgi:hypothetical protein
MGVEVDVATLDFMGFPMGYLAGRGAVFHKFAPITLLHKEIHLATPAGRYIY